MFSISKHIRENVRSLRAPPDVVRDVLEGVLRLMGIADTSWSAMKNFLSKRGVKEDIRLVGFRSKIDFNVENGYFSNAQHFRCLDASQISPAALQSVQRLLEKRGASFEASVAKRASAACAPLAAWVRANLEYARALQRVQPLQAHQARLHTNLQEAEDQLSALSSGLASVDQRVSALKEQLGQHTRDAAAIEMRLNAAADTLRAAQHLLDQLAHEYTAWENDLQVMTSLRNYLATSNYLFINTSVKEVDEVRDLGILIDSQLTFVPQTNHVVAKAAKMLGFIKRNSKGFKAHTKLLLYNALVRSQLDYASTSCNLRGIPLIISPYCFREHIKAWCKLIGLKEASFSVINFLSTTEKQLSQLFYCYSSKVLETPKCGFTPLLIDPDGEGLLWLRNTLADVTCDFVSQHSDKLLTAVQHAVSAPGNQLIHYSLQQQNPEISGKSKEIKMQKAKLQKQQHELQENLLRDLSSNSDILHDASLLASLNKTRETNTTISKALEAAHEIERANGEACAKYEPSAKRAAALALAVKRLNARWPLVVLPVDAVLETFVEAVRKANHPWIPDECLKSTAKLKATDEDLYSRLSLHNADLWRQFISSGDLSAVSTLKLSPFESVVSVASIRPDSLYRAITAFVDTVLGGCVARCGGMAGCAGRGARRRLARADGGGLALHQGAASTESFNEEFRMWIVSEYRDIPPLVANACVNVILEAPEGVKSNIMGTLSTWGNYEADPKTVRLHACLAIFHALVQERRAYIPQGACKTVRLHAWLAIFHALVQERRAYIPQGAYKTVRLHACLAIFHALVQERRAYIPQGACKTVRLHVCLSIFHARWCKSGAPTYRKTVRLHACLAIFHALVQERCAYIPQGACKTVRLHACLAIFHALVQERCAYIPQGACKTVRLHACLVIFHALVQERRAYIPQGWSRWYSWEWGEVCACAGAIRAGGAALCLPLYSARVHDAHDARLLGVLHARYLSTATAPTFPVSLPTAGSLQIRDFKFLLLF
ncbi:Cytoplasmic dynein 2 heavy chain 1 [Operophtera brumata]|uniref:Cytoplasmic dynein 2 heavy chain 1 n=1 Tax=Operophtera brumata TaxID=104452 RepID=A0A0L7LQY1_OPEBR|nr:Cytoplasmic dynein 2 heavy chain 1 [Operophtera brumata]